VLLTIFPEGSGRVVILSCSLTCLGAGSLGQRPCNERAEPTVHNKQKTSEIEKKYFILPAVFNGDISDPDLAKWVVLMVK